MMGLPEQAAGATATPTASAFEPVVLTWLEGAVPQLAAGITVGVPWPQGTFRKDQAFSLAAADGAPIAVQSWPTAFWPDGSLKWTAHALPANAGMTGRLSLKPVSGKAASSANTTGSVSLKETAGAIEVDTGVIRCIIKRKGADLVESITRDGRQIARAGKLIARTDDQPDGEAGTTHQQQFISDIDKVTVEQRGPVRAVVKIEGRHKSGDRAWLPFIVRLYFYAGAESLRIMHTFIFDGDEQKEFIRGIGLRFEVPLRDPLYDRHVRFAGEGDGQWAEGVRNITGLRRDPGEAVRKAQLAGVACPPLEQWTSPVPKLLHLVPAWGDYTLAQLSADGFQVRKRTKAGHGWVEAAWGRRAPGVGYIGGASGGLAFGLRDFWQRHPTQLDIRGAHTEQAEVTLWMWSPDAPAMDLRFYHDGMGMDTHAEEIEGLDITYEDYEKGFGTPVGVARSSEITLWALAATPSRERLNLITRHVQTPPQLVAQPARFLSTKVFGGMWSLPDRSHPVKAAIEDQLDFRFDFYKKEVEQRHWYGFWDYGDIRHTYDEDRHEWRYDVGGFAWDNSELSPDLWLWYSFLRTGRADIFRLAEAMVRHTSEVDTYHLGRFAGLGTRHNVQHWGCSAKQVRISAAVYRRFYYFLTADERIGDIMHSLLDADTKLDAVDPVRKLPKQPPKGPYPARISFGTDWGSLVGNWLTEWERNGSPKYRDKIRIGMKDIVGMPHGFFSANRMGYDPADGHLYNVAGDSVVAQHLNAVFGGFEIFAELIALTGDERFERAWLEYCELFNASEAEQIKALGKPHKGSKVLYVGHSRLTAYAAWKKKDPALAKRAWREFLTDGTTVEQLRTSRIAGANALNPVDEVIGLSTNSTAQWGLAAIQNLALIGEFIPGSGK